MDIWYYVLTPFTWLLTLFYNIFGSYGAALIVFALIVKLILFPFSLKGKRGMIQMNMLNGKIQAIQKKYANDRERQNLEVQKLYEREKVNPMSGCLWTMVPLFILFPLYAIIRQPMKYAMGLDPTQIETLMEVLGAYMTSAGNAAYQQLQGADVLAKNFQEIVSNPAVAEFADQLQALNFQFLGLNLADIPTLKFWANGINWNSIGLFLIPIISAVTGFVFSLISMKTNSVNNQSAQQNSTSKSMLIMSPLMSLWIGFMMPGCLGVYWVANNLLSMLQEFVAGKMLKKDYEAAAAAREEQERLEKEEEKRRRREAAERKAQALADAKANKGKKKLPVEKKKSDASVISVSGVGVRAYARGRAYDPYRYRPEGPTAYRDPGEPVDEAAVEEALEKKRRFFGKKKQEEPEASKKLAEEALECQADEAVVEELLEERAAEQPEQTPAVPEESTLDVDDPWKALDQEVKDITADPEQDGETKQ